MPVPVWVPGQKLASADVNNWFVPLIKYKTAATSLSSQTAYQNDPDLQFTSTAIPASAVYLVTALIIYSSAAVCDMKQNFLVGTGATFEVSVSYLAPSGSLASLAPFAYNALPAMGTPNSSLRSALLTGVYFQGSTASGLTYQWAQNNSNATALVVQAGSYLMGQRIG